MTTPDPARDLHLEGCDTWRRVLDRQLEVLDENPQRTTKILCQPQGRYVLVWW